MTIDELIELAQDAREDLGGDAQVRIAYQPGYPLRAALQYVTVPFSTDPSELYDPDDTAAGQENDGTFLWLAAGDLPDKESPYAPGWAWLPTSPHRSNSESSVERHLAPYPCTAAGSRALADHLGDARATGTRRSIRHATGLVNLRPTRPFQDKAQYQAQYQAYPGYTTLICFVYDPGHFLANPTAIEHDLSSQDGGLTTSVVISPRGL